MQISGKKAVVTGVAGKRTFTDGDRVVEQYYIDGGVHAQGFLMVYVSKEKILIMAAGCPSASCTQPLGRKTDLVF